MVKKEKVPESKGSSEEETAGQKTIMPEDEIQLEPENEEKSWQKVQMQENEDGSIFFDFPEVPMLKKVNRKTSYLVFFSVVIIMLLGVVAYFGNEKFSENKKHPYINAFIGARVLFFKY